MDWKQATGIYENRLTMALHVHRHALNLAKISTVGIDVAQIDLLRKIEKPARTQLSRLRKKEFRIAVVGLEKAGKSTFVNAWLEKDLLPHQNARCTYTTTQIHSVANDRDQRLEIEAKSKSNFDQMVAALEEKAMGNDDSAKFAQKDLDAINRYRDNLETIIDQQDQSIEFEHLESIAEPLKKYVANEKYAHAVQEARIFTSRLAAADGIVFFDVPGLDSGLGKHLEDSKEMLENCDAVICIQRSDNPSLKAGEQKLIEFIKSGDKQVDIEDKLFVFFGRIDGAGSHESFQRDFGEAKAEWHRYGMTRSDRIVPGSAAGYLVLKNVAGQELKSNIGPEILSNLQRITKTGQKDVENATGIPIIKNIIGHYLKTERVKILEKRCDHIIAQILAPAKQIYAKTAAVFPENPEDAIKEAEKRRKRTLNQWWKEEKWESIKAEFKRFFDGVLEDDLFTPISAAGAEAKPMEKFKKRYMEKVTTKIKQLPNRQENRRKNIFDSIPGRVFDKNYINYEWRNRLENDTHKFIEEVSAFLSEEIIGEADDLLAKLAELLWHVDPEKISRIIIRSRNDLKKQMIHGLRTLFLRFARPVARVLIAAPQKSDRRKKIIEEIGPDIELLDAYYDGDEPAFQCMKKYVNHGRKLLVNSELREQVLGTRHAVSNPAWLKSSAYQNEPLEIQETIDEVEGDLLALEEYLIHAVFKAAGFLVYRKHELERIYQIFEEKDYEWRLLMEDEFYDQNAILLDEVPNECKGDPLDIEVCEGLKQLRIALDNFQSAG